MSAPEALRLAPTTSRLSRQLHHGQPLHFFDGPPDEIDFELEHATSHPPRPRPVSGDSATLSGEPLAHDKPPIIYVEFEENDPRDPYNFSLGRKMIICGLAFTFTLLAVFDLSSFAIGIQAMREELNMSEIEGSLGISLYSFAFGVAPMFLAPLSEEWGRNVLYISSAIIFALFHIPTALAQNRATVLVSRTILGIAGSTGSTMVGGTISDIFRTKSRGLPMAIFSLAAFTGTGLGAVCCGWVVQDPSLGWRWVQWINLILAGVLVPAMFFLMKETRSAVLLSRMAHAKRKETGDVRYRSKADEERPPLLQLLQISLLRPTVLLFTEPTVTVFSLWLGFAWGLLYGLLEAIPYVFETLYHWRTGTVGLAYLAIVIGGFVGFCGTFLQEAMYRRHHGRLGPEARLYSACAGAVTFPIGCFIFAWTSYSDVHWIGPIIGTTIAVAGIYNIYLSGFIYLADAYQIYSSSALAAQSFSRNIFGGVFPLFITIMYRNLNPRWAATTFGFIAIVCACIPFVLMRWGPYIRSRSKFAQSLADLDPVVPRVDPEAPKSSSP